DPWYVENLVCPVDRSKLDFDGVSLVSKHGRLYPVVEGVPVLLVADETQTIGVAQASIERAKGKSEVIDRRETELYLGSIGITENEKEDVINLYRKGTTSIDPVVIKLIAATCGNGYIDLTRGGHLENYPIPDIDLTPLERRSTLLDIGCN